MKKSFFRLAMAAIMLTFATFLTSCVEEVKRPDPIEVSIENPRYMAADGENIYITCYSPRAVIRFDTFQKAVTGICTLGDYNPEGICALNGKLYIASSNIADQNNNYIYNNKLYVVDIASFKLCDSITVGLNPAKVMALDNNHVVVNSLGDYPEIGGTVYRSVNIVNVNTKEVSTIDADIFTFNISNDNIYGYSYPYSGSITFLKINASTHEVTNILSSWSSTNNPYGIYVNDNNGDIYVSNANYNSNGKLMIFSADGTLRNTYDAGMYPSKIVPIDADNLLVLDEGLWGENDADITHINLKDNSSTVHFFTDNNGRGLGDVAQDMIIYGGKAYTTVTMSNTLEVMDPISGKSQQYKLK